MIRPTLSVLFVSISLLTFSDEFFETERIIDSVTCLHDTSQYYALYLPSNYSKEKKWPIIYFFEPAARAKLPLEKYAALAEEFEYILVCTYNSRNGPRGPNLEAADALLKDTQERFSLDNRRLYASGFSGGARVASLAAILSGKINTVLACGAGFPNDKKPVAGMRFSFFGMVGSFDMNFQELFNLDRELSNLNFHHQMEYYEDGHNWPDAKIFERAFYWIEMNAMRKKMIPIDRAIVNTFQGFYQDDSENLSPLNKTYWQYHLEQKFINYLEGLTNVSSYKEKAEDIYNSPEFKEEALRIKTIIDHENKQRRVYQEELNNIAKSATDEDQYTKSNGWWKKELVSLYVSDDTPLNSDQLYVNKRLYDYIWRVAWGRYEDYF